MVVSRICVLGPFTVESDGGPIPEAELGNRKARLLLKLLVARRPDHVPMDTIVDVLWPDRAPAKALENAATLVSRLRGSLGRDVIEGGRSGYRLVVPPGCSVDADDAEALVREAEAGLDGGRPARAVTAVTQALEVLGGGPGMQEESDAGDWLEEFRRRIGRLVRRARAAGWRANAGIGEHRRALALAEDALAADRFDEEAHRAVMLAYQRLGEPGEALAAYERARAMLVEELGADPGPETEALYLAILRDEPIASEDEPPSQDSIGRAVVGRDVEMETLLNAWDEATRGTPTCVVVSGESGIGKTHLVEALMDDARATGATAALARCYESEQSLFLQPIIEMLRELVGTLPPAVVAEAAGSRGDDLVGLVPDFGFHVESAPRGPTTPEMERRRVFEAVSCFLAEVSKQRPLLLVLDDVHNAGASTLELAHFALRWDRAAPLMIATTAQSHRSTEVESHLGGSAITVTLGPLADSAVRQLAQDAGHAELAPELMRLTKGHTLFVLEALTAITHSGDLVIPDTLRDAVTARVRRCGADVDEFLRAAVVAGLTFDVEHVAELLGISAEEAVSRGEKALHVGLLAEAGAGYEFANDVIRDVLYDTTPTPTRVLRHRRLARLLHDRPEAAADHAAAAADWELAVDRWLEAAARSLSAFANREAEILLTRAMDACTLVGDPSRTGRVQLLRGRALLGQALYHDASHDFAAVQTLASATADPELEATAMEELAWCAYHARQMDRAETLADRALRHPAAGPRMQILAGRLHNTRGDLTAAIEALQPVADHDDPILRASALSYLGSALAHSDRFTEAIAVLEDAVTGCEVAGLLRPLFTGRFFLALTRANLGDLGGALDAATRLADDAARYDSDAYKPRACNALSFLWRELGEPEQALDFALEALETSRLPDGYVEAEPAAHARLALAESYLQRGDDTEAMHWLDELSDTVLDGVAFGWRVELHRLELHARLDPSHAEELLSQAQRYDSAKYAALAFSHLGRHDEATDLAKKTQSDLLVAHVAPESVARRAAERIAAGLPTERRSRFLERGPWIAPWT